METGREFTEGLTLPGPHKRQDGARTREAEPETAYSVPVMPGKSLYLKILR